MKISALIFIVLERHVLLRRTEVARPSALFLFLVALPALAAPSSPEVHSVPLSIGYGVSWPNNPRVSVTVCVPGTSQCQTIENLQLDTGSTGLRIFRAPLGALALPDAHDSDGNVLAECDNWSPSFWGPLKRADVIVGGLKASNIEVQVVDPTFLPPPPNCPPIDQPAPGYDGILGLSVQPWDCYGEGGACDWPRYFTCQGPNCSEASLPAHLRLSNIAAQFPSDNNGFVIQFPPVTGLGLSGVTGTLTFGIGTNAANQVIPGVMTVPTDTTGRFPLSYGPAGRTFPALIDSGTGNLKLPFATSGPTCASTDYGQVLCPNQDITLQLPISPPGQPAFSLPLWVANGTALLASGNGALPGFANQEPSEPSDPGLLLLGVPFFFGRTLYFGISGTSSPLGAGPRVAFPAAP